MDSLDASLLRGLMRDHTYDFQGIDLRRSTTALARYVGISRNAAGERLATWRKTGFRGMTSVYVNPSLVGRKMEGRFYAVSDSRKLVEFLVHLKGQPGMFLVFETGTGDGTVMLGTVRLVPLRPSKGSKSRGSSLGSSGPAVPVSPCFPITFPRCDGSMRPGDWHLVGELRRDPELDPELLAKRVGLSIRQLRRRLDRLIDSNALFAFPHFDFTKARGSVVVVTVIVRNPESLEGVRGQLAQRCPDWVSAFPSAPTEMLLPPEFRATPARAIQFLAPVRTGQDMPILHRDLVGMDGIVGVHMTTPLRSDEIRSSFDRLIGQRAHGRANRPRAG
ncbi:MAG: Lrp/AsnC family transcriptional regulator [Thermoplasmata archaeon]|nr:Lrp/AsnC family transcriptional regulator [Thermoplasmata archaeon]